MRVNTGKAISKLNCYLPKVRLHLTSYDQHLFQPVCASDTHTHTHLLNCISLFLESAYEAPVPPLAPYPSKLDAGSGCLNASVKLRCGCLILGSLHLPVFTIVIFQKEKAG